MSAAPKWPATDDTDVAKAIERLRRFAEELLAASPDLTCTGRLEEGEIALLEVKLGDRVLAEVHLVGDIALGADQRIYGLVGESAEFHEEDFAGTQSEIITRLIELASNPE